MSFLKKLFKKEKEGKKERIVEKQEKEVVREASVDVGIKVKKGHLITGVLLSSHITEKSSDGAAKNKYVFSVARDTNKHMVKKAVESRYGVHVDTVRILNMPGKERRRGRQIGWKSGFKKAVVRVREGEKIEVQ